jgi:hypothetical protein
MRHSRRRACGSRQRCGRQERAHISLQNRRRFSHSSHTPYLFSLSDNTEKPGPLRLQGQRPTDSAEEAFFFTGIAEKPRVANYDALIAGGI